MSKYKFLGALAAITNQFGSKRINRQTIAAETGLSENYIKKLVQGLGGIKAFRKWVLSLWDLHFLQKLGITGLTTAGITGGGMGSSFTPAQAMSLLHTSTGQVGTIEPSTGVFTSLANGPTLTDIALTETNELFGVSFGQLYKVDTNTNSFSLIGNLGVGNMNGLGFEREGNLYGTGGNGFYQIDTATGRANLVSSVRVRGWSREGNKARGEYRGEKHTG